MYSRSCGVKGQGAGVMRPVMTAIVRQSHCRPNGDQTSREGSRGFVHPLRHGRNRGAVTRGRDEVRELFRDRLFCCPQAHPCGKSLLF